ncbi:conserved exported hypothetical protein [Luteimonas sp. 9C]|uniref:hypothetical protein n=1 Tax=Luteimonas sp. 9C TaxID=2653148 RepID=UPI0012F1363A|nr:hypothetical protein [Luteimonas sp. 9C]VXC10265.1 conserved exported hypothetical protein [Luteimonas sp. 9C]
MPLSVVEAAVRPRVRCAALAACLLVASPLVAAEREEARALARDDGRLLYREVHYQDHDGDAARRVVLYRCPDGAAFARKVVRTQGVAAQPDFAFIDARSGYREGVRTQGGAREIFVQRGDAAPRTAALPATEGAVIDAGFDAAVRARWSALGESPQRLSFLLPERLTFMPVRVEKVDDAGGVRRLRMSVDRWFGFAVAPIELQYGLEDRRLREFAGPGTVRDARGKPREVRIVFPVQPPSRVAATEVAAALAEPLTGRCAT